jgi:hypothetical protein
MMEFMLAGFKEGEGVREFRFDWVAADRSRRTVIVRADITLARKHDIRIQELPLLCRRLLENVQEGALPAAITLTEDHMIVIQSAARLAAEKKVQRPPRRPPTAAGQAWRNTVL